jgi:hypothetical protein
MDVFYTPCDGKPITTVILDTSRRRKTCLTFPYRDFSEYACGLADDTP